MTMTACAGMCAQVGASVEQDTAYPGWAPNPGSVVVGLAKEVLEEVTGHTVKVQYPSLTCVTPSWCSCHLLPSAHGVGVCSLVWTSW